MARYLKNERQSKILEIIDRTPIQDAKQLMEALKEEGFECDDATIYRDILDMHLASTVRKDGRIGLATPAYVAHESLAERLAKLTVEAGIQVEILDMYVKVRCIHGCAEAMAASVNALNFDEVFCCVVAGDDLLVICKSADKANRVFNILGKVINR